MRPILNVYGSPSTMWVAIGLGGRAGANVGPTGSSKICSLAFFLTLCLHLQTPAAGRSFSFESLTLENGDAPITLNLAYQPASVQGRPVILMLGSINSNQLPNWSTNLVSEGYMLAAFTAAHVPDPDPDRRPVWLYFD